LLGSSSHVPKGPWAQQAIALEKITDAKAELESSLFYQELSELTSAQWRLTRSHISAALKNATEAQKAIAKPVAYRFELEQLTPAAIAACRQ
jgi:hypothetical protein